MTILKLSALGLILGFLGMFFASVVGPPRLYLEPDPEERLRLIDAFRLRWLFSNALFALGGLLTALGMFALSWHFRDIITTWINIGAAATFFGGAFLWIRLVFDRQMNPARYFLNYSFQLSSAVMLGLSLSGLLLYGVVFLQVGFPIWLGYLTIGGPVLIGALAVAFPAQFFASFPPQVLYLFTLMVGIVGWRLG